MNLSEKDLNEIMIGASLLAGGGGGSLSSGINAGLNALSTASVNIIPLVNLSPQSVLATVSVVGAVSEKEIPDIDPDSIQNSLQFINKYSQQKIAGIIPSEIGPWALGFAFQVSALSGLPVIDAPCNGRAHPASVMGSLQLEKLPGYSTVVAASTIDRSITNHISLFACGLVQNENKLIRDASTFHGIMSVIRNPINVAYIAQHAAVGAIQQARELGRIHLQSSSIGLDAFLEKISKQTNGKTYAIGTVEEVSLFESEGYTIGKIIIRAETGQEFSVLVCNEFMMAMENGYAVAVFPDLITLLDTESCLPILSTSVRIGHRVALYTIDRNFLNLASTMSDPDLYKPIERLLNVPFTV